MKVWTVRWDIRNGGQGVEVYASREMAVNAVVGYAREMALANNGAAEDEARNVLLATGLLEFERAECFYSVEEHDVQTGSP